MNQVMTNCLHISLFMLHFSAGCNLSNEEQTKQVTGYTGGSVLLPCFCNDPQSSVKKFTWEINRNENKWINVFKNEKNSRRLNLFNESLPTNLSLLISGLGKDDEGYYKCKTKSHSLTFVRLTVKDLTKFSSGCDLVKKHTDHTETVTGYKGESVVLPCSCTEPLAKPDQLKWKYHMNHDYREFFPSEDIKRYKNRSKVLNQTTPGNLSLHLLSLTKEDEGFYACSASSEYQHIIIRVDVKEKPLVHTIHSSTYQPLRQTHELITTQQTEDPVTQRSHHMPLYVVILIAVFASVLLLTLLYFIYWSCTGRKNVKKLTTDSPVIARESENEDEVAYSAVFLVKKGTITASMQIDGEEHTEYASINVK